MDYVYVSTCTRQKPILFCRQNSSSRRKEGSKEERPSRTYGVQVSGSLRSPPTPTRTPSPDVFVPGRERVSWGEHQRRREPLSRAAARAR